MNSGDWRPRIYWQVPKVLYEVCVESSLTDMTVRTNRKTSENEQIAKSVGCHLLSSGVALVWEATTSVTSYAPPQTTLDATISGWPGRLLTAAAAAHLCKEVGNAALGSLVLLRQMNVR